MDCSVESLGKDDVQGLSSPSNKTEEAPKDFPACSDTQHYLSTPEELMRTICDEHDSFHFQSDVELPKDSQSSRVLRCLTCLNFKSIFYCYSCIKHGQFRSSKSSHEIEEKFHEKKLKYYLNHQVKSSLVSDISQLLQEKLKMYELEREINTRRRYVDNLRSLLQQRNRKLLAIKTERSRLQVMTRNDDRLPKEMKDTKIEFTKRYISKIKEKIQQKQTMSQSNMNNIKGLTWELSYQLRSSIFTLDVFNPYENDQISTNSEESVPLLGHYSGSGFDHITPNNETKYTVIEPWISASADILPYVTWVHRHQDEISTSESLGMRNDAFRTSAALANLCQMTQVLAGILDLWLPRRLTFREFFSRLGQDVEFLTEEELRNKVAKLNVNVSYLCLSQKLDPDLLQIRQPVKNIIDLLNPSLPSELGRRGPVELDSEFLASVESALSTDLQLFEDHFSCYYSSQDCDQDFELDFDMIPNWPGGADGLPSPSDVSSLAGSYLPSPGIFTSVISRMFTRE